MDKLPRWNDSDEYIKQWAINNTKCDIPKTKVFLQNASKDGFNVAEIQWARTVEDSIVIRACEDRP